MTWSRRTWAATCRSSQLARARRSTTGPRRRRPKERAPARAGSHWRHRRHPVSLLIGRLPKYPIPDIPLEEGRGRTLVDIGCNWGRWTVAAARRGYRPIGVDPSLEALLGRAEPVCGQLGVEADFVIGDARHLPLRTASIDTAFSYSVIQHFSRAGCGTGGGGHRSRAGARRRPLVQMPNVSGCGAWCSRRGAASASRGSSRSATGRRRSFADVRSRGWPLAPLGGRFLLAERAACGSRAPATAPAGARAYLFGARARRGPCPAACQCGGQPLGYFLKVLSRR